MGKTFVAFCVCRAANTWFMSGLRKRRRRQDAFFNCQRVGESVVKDREQCCLLIALIVRREGEIICKDREQGIATPRTKSCPFTPLSKDRLPKKKQAWTGRSTLQPARRPALLFFASRVDYTGGRLTPTS